MSGSFFQFQNPAYLLFFLLVLPLFFFEMRKKHFVRLPLSSILVLSQRKKTWRQRLEFFPTFLKIVALTLLISALARPQWGNRYTEVDSEGIDIVLTLDTSESMVGLDLTLNGEEANRLQVIKSVVNDFIGGRQYDRIGMVVFGEQAYTQCPLTTDYNVLKSYLDIVEIGIAGKGTAIGNAIAVSVKRLETSKAKSKIIILLTDGESNAGEVSPKIAAELAAQRGIKIYTIGVGTQGAVPVYQDTLFGRRKVTVEMHFDEKSLKEIAAMTAGQYFSAGSQEALKDVYQTIDKLEKTQVKVQEFSDVQEMFLLFLVPAVLFLVLSWFLEHAVFIRVF
jgi:Ca-activated chloride channel family protein